uniref:hypothetical protein n=1 Tax=Pararhizobium sp. IMCC3301 TaxID=3067904 RepID=UPI0027403BA8|nr:hypothetical protein [Pararhizobium sp. IMCC3301]
MFSISAILLYILFFVIGWLVARWWWSKKQAEQGGATASATSSAHTASGSAASAPSRTTPAKPAGTTASTAKVEPDKTMPGKAAPVAASTVATPSPAKPAKPAKPVAAKDPGKPERLDGPRDGTADDLKRIRGVGPSNEKKLNAFGIYHFDQIGNWTSAQAEWIGKELSFPGRIEREDWIEQAKVLASGGDTEFSKRTV